MVGVTSGLLRGVVGASIAFATYVCFVFLMQLRECGSPSDALSTLAASIILLLWAVPVLVGAIFGFFVPLRKKTAWITFVCFCALVVLVNVWSAVPSKHCVHTLS